MDPSLANYCAPTHKTPHSPRQPQVSYPMVVNQYSPLRLLGDRWRWGPFVRLSFRMGASLWFVASRRPSR